MVSASVLIVTAIILRSTIGFTQVVDSFAILFFVLLGFWFTYDNAKRKDGD
jgi:positive regulator of sigma E activity